MASVELPPLPEGWTRERVFTLSGDELIALPPDLLTPIRAWLSADTRNFLAQQNFQPPQAADDDDDDGDEDDDDEDDDEDEEMIDEEQLAEEMGLLPSDLEGALADVARIVMNDGLDVWGFCVFKTWGYKGAQKAEWDQYWARWQEFMDKVLRDDNEVKGDLRTGLCAKLLWHLIEDESLDGATFEVVREKFGKLADDETMFPNGLDVDLCLVIGKEEARSLLDEKGGGVPYVTGVAKESEVDSEGHFKIAVDVLVPDVWYLLSVITPGELDPGNGLTYRGPLTGQELKDDE